MSRIYWVGINPLASEFSTNSFSFSLNTTYFFFRFNISPLRILRSFWNTASSSLSNFFTKFLGVLFRGPKVERKTLCHPSTALFVRGKLSYRLSRIFHSNIGNVATWFCSRCLYTRRRSKQIPDLMHSDHSDSPDEIKKGKYQCIEWN
jgi:hypothetical protein